MTLQVVYATTTAMVDGFHIRYGSVWPTSDPLVQANPSLFTSDPREAGLSTSAPLPAEDQIREADRFEQATAAPGEKRNVRRG